MKDYTLCLGNTSKISTINDMKKTLLKESVNFFSVDFNPFNPIDTNDILYIHRYLVKEKEYKTMFGLIKKRFVGLLIIILNAPNHAKCVSLRIQ